MIQQMDMLQHFSTEKVAIIVQQTNCVATKVHKGYLSDHIVRKLPFANPYKHRQNLRGFANLAAEPYRPKLGTVDIFKPKQGNYATVACLNAQFKMGGPNSLYFTQSTHAIDSSYWEEASKDTAKQRFVNFQMCLRELQRLLSSDPDFGVYKYVAFPQFIGCGAAKGNWTDYLSAISSFTEAMKIERPDIKCIICQLPLKR